MSPPNVSLTDEPSKSLATNANVSRATGERIATIKMKSAPMQWNGFCKSVAAKTNANNAIAAVKANSAQSQHAHGLYGKCVIDGRTRPKCCDQKECLQDLW